MDKQYLYRPNRAMILMAVMILGSFLAFCVYQALSLDESISYRNGRITLTQFQAKIFLWGFSAILLYVISLGLLGLMRSFGPPRAIRLTDTDLITPKSAASSKIVQVPIKSITSIKVVNAAKKEILHIKYLGGKVSVPEGVFENEFKFSSFKAELQQCIASSKIANKSNKKAAQRARASS